MAVLKQTEKIGVYTVQNLIKANRYTETYRIVDEDNHPFFLKLFILNTIPSKLINQETHCVKEIEYCRQLNHRNIVSHISDGRLDKESGSYQYYLTDYFSGPVLADRLSTNGKMSEEEAMPIFRQILVGLQYMHSQATALCHNDITPSNIVLNDAMNGEAVIIDLGHTCTPCAGIAEFDTTDLDVLYHAKETMVGIFDQQTDIFSACATLYAMLTGRAPWMIDVASEGDYKERFKAMWQYRQTHPLQTPEGISPKVKAILEEGLALNGEDLSAHEVVEITAQIMHLTAVPLRDFHGVEYFEVLMCAVDKADVEFLFAELFQDFLLLFVAVPDKTEVAADYECVTLLELSGGTGAESVEIAVDIASYKYQIFTSSLFSKE